MSDVVIPITEKHLHYCMSLKTAFFLNYQCLISNSGNKFLKLHQTTTQFADSSPCLHSSLAQWHHVSLWFSVGLLSSTNIPPFPICRFLTHNVILEQELCTEQYSCWSFNTWSVHSIILSITQLLSKCKSSINDLIIHYVPLWASWSRLLRWESTVRV